MTRIEKQIVIDALKLYAENKENEYWCHALGLVYVFESILNDQAGTVKI